MADLFYLVIGTHHLPTPIQMGFGLNNRVAFFSTLISIQEAGS